MQWPFSPSKNSTSHKHSVVVWSAVAFLLLLGVASVWLMQRQRVTTTTTAVPPPPTLDLTQFAAKGHLSLPVVVPQFPVAKMTIQSPSEYFIEGQRVSEAEFYSRTRSSGDAVGTTLLERRDATSR